MASSRRGSETVRCAAARGRPPRVSRQHSIQSLEALAGPGLCAGLGSADADDHRRSWRAVKAEPLEHVVDWMVEKFTLEHWSVPEIKAVLAQPELCKSPEPQTAGAVARSRQ